MYIYKVKQQDMSLIKEINKEPYLKISNCIDKSDLDFSFNKCLELENKYGKSKTLNKLFSKILSKLEKYED